jgi:hypothetical protein
MKLKDLEKINKIYIEIKDLNDNLVYLHKLAVNVADSKSIVTLNLNETNLKIKELEEKQNMFDEDGSLNKPSSGSRSLLFQLYGIDAPKPKPTNSTHLYTEALTDVLTLELLGVIIANKQKEKQKLINKLSKYKIEL